MNARAVFNRSEAVLEYRPTPTLDGSYSWYWILLSTQDACLGSGTAPNRATASTQARLKARQLGRHISKVRIAGSQQEGLKTAVSKTFKLHEAASARDFIMAQPDDRRYRVVLVKPNGWRYYYTDDPKPGETAPQWCGGDPTAQWYAENAADRALPLTADQAEERAARCRAFKGAKTLRWEVVVEPIPVTETEPLPARDFILQNPSWESRLEQFTGPPKQHMHDDPAFKKSARYQMRRTWPMRTLIFDLIAWFKPTGEIHSVKLTASYWKTASYVQAVPINEIEWEDAETYYGDMNVLLDRLEPVLQTASEWEHAPVKNLVQHTFHPFLRWVYENPGQVKI